MKRKGSNKIETWQQQKLLPKMHLKKKKYNQNFHLELVRNGSLFLIFHKMVLKIKMKQ